MTPASPSPPPSSSCQLYRGPPSRPPTIPGECSAEWMAPDRGLRGWNVSLALQGSHPPEHWRTAQSLLINHCQGCPGPGPNNHLDAPPFFEPLSNAQPSQPMHMRLSNARILAEMYIGARVSRHGQLPCIHLPLSSPLYSEQFSSMSFTSATNSSLAMYSPSVSFFSIVDRSIGV